jgi:hypothetical protein
LSDGRLLLLYLAVLFEKLVEQHRVHRFVADGLRFSMFISGDQDGVNLGHFLGNQPE